MMCPNCRSEVELEETNCPNCGAVVSAMDATREYTPVESHHESATKERRLPLFFWPLLSVAMEILAVGSLWYPPTRGNYPLSISLGAGMYVFLLADIVWLARIGLKGPWKISVIIPPWYLYLRAKKTNRRYVWFVLSLIALIACISAYMIDTVVSMTMRSSLGPYL